MAVGDEASGICVYQEPHIPFRATGVAWPHSPAHWRPRHCHRELELNLVTSGRGRFALDTGEHELGRGEVIWFLPHTGHELLSATADFDMWVVAFRPELVESVNGAARAVERALSANTGGSLRLDERVLLRLEAACRRAFQLVCDGRAPDRTLMGRILADLACETAREREQADERQIHSAARRARTLLCLEPWLGRGEVAERLLVSESTLAHAFRRQIGVTLDEYRNRVRLGRLLEGLEHEPQSLLGAALAAGFGSAAQYHRCVRALTGCRPSDLKHPEVRRALAERVRSESAESAH
jgi:AraC-like DNA-binding protein/quercetin dioxygenase-like cupin family protein